jgi:hypothetical protein
MLLSCVNCSFNPLLADGIGTGDGYCANHRVVLHKPHTLTCGRLLRKDLALPDAEREQDRHRTRFSTERVAPWPRPDDDAARAGLVDKDVSQLRRDEIGRIVTDYALYSNDEDAPKMMFLGQLAVESRRGLARAEVAQHSLGRTYVRNCVRRDGRGHWTSANYLVEWTKEFLRREPNVDYRDLSDAAVKGGRKEELARWEIVMLRLQFLADVAHLAPDDDPIAQLRDLPERAARANRDVAFAPLMKWARTRGWELAEAAFPSARFAAIRDQKRNAARPAKASLASEGGPRRRGK